MGPKMLCVFTQKGGVGKTTATYNLATTLALGGARVLMIDGDPQANLTRNAIRFNVSSFVKNNNITINEDVKNIVINLIEENLLLSIAFREIPQGTEADPFLELMNRMSGYDVLVSAIKAVNKSQQNEEKNPVAQYMSGENVDRDKIMKDFKPLIDMISHLNQSENILTALEWINRDVGPGYIDNHAIKMAGHLFPVHFNDEHGKKNDNLLLLPGHQFLYLHHSRPIALAIEGLKGGYNSTLAAFSGRLYRINQVLRKLGEIKDIDIIVIDLSPTAIEFNQALVMMSDYLTMTLSPEPNSDHAMFSMLPILRHWKNEFNRIYGVASDAGFMPIQFPPKVLGIFFQKASTHLNEIRSPVSKFIISRIEDFYDNVLTEYLQEQNMNGGVKATGMPKISNFTSDAKKAQYLGEPVVLKKEMPYQDSFKRIISLILGNQKEHLPPRLVTVVDNYTKHKQTSFDRLSKNWTQRYVSYIENMDDNTRFEKLKHFKHHLDYFDFGFLLRNVILKKHKSIKQYQDNPDRIYVTNPIVIDNSQKTENYFLAPLNAEFEKIPHKETIPKILIIPFLMDNRWRCIRVELINDKTMDILFDDPYGGRLVKNDSNKKNAEFVWDDALRLYIISALTVLLTRHYRLNVTSWYPRCKNHNQQDISRTYEGYSGLIILNNISQYMTTTRNMDFKKICSYKILEEYANRMKLEEVILSHDIPRSVLDDSYPVDISNLTFQKIKARYERDLKRIINVNDPNLISLYKKCIEYFRSLPIRENQERAEAQLSAFVFESLELILDEQRGIIDRKFNEVFEENPDSIVDFIASAQIFYDHNKNPSDPFSKHAIEAGEKSISPKTIVKKRSRSKASVDQSLKLMLSRAIILADYKFSQTPGRTHFFGLLSPHFHFTAGNCLFDAIAAQAPGATAQQLRAQAVNQIRQDESLKALILAMANNSHNLVRTRHHDQNYSSIEQYLDLMAQDRTWGTYTEIRALADALQRPIIIFGPTFEQIFNDERYVNNEPIFLNYVNNNHFEPLQVPPGRNARDIFNEVVQNSYHENASPGHAQQPAEPSHVNKRQKMSTNATTSLFYKRSTRSSPRNDNISRVSPRNV